MDGEYDKDLKRVEASEGRLHGITWCDEGGELNEAAASHLYVPEGGDDLILQ